MTPHKNDFKAGTYKELSTTESYLGSGGSGAILGHGTEQYIITDDMGDPYTIEIPGMAYSPAVPHRLLALQFIQNTERLKRENDSEIFHATTTRTGIDIQEAHSVLTYDHGKREKNITYTAGTPTPGR